MVELSVFFIMALNIKNEEVERLVNEVARLAGESKTEAVDRRSWSAVAASSTGPAETGVIR